MPRCCCYDCLCMRERKVTELLCSECANNNHYTEKLTDEQIERLKIEAAINDGFYRKLIRPDTWASCFCVRKQEDCTYCKQHRGTQFKFADKDNLIKQEFLGFDGRFAKHDPYDMFGFELNMFSQRLLKKLI